MSKTNRPRTLKMVEQGSYTFTARTGETFTVRRVRGDAHNSYAWVARGSNGTYFDSLHLDMVRANLKAL